MLVNNANLKTLFTAFNGAFKSGLGQAATQYGQIATTVPSSTAAQEYGWLGQLPNLREWLGDRHVHAIANHGYTVKNKSFELTVGVPREAIEDDNYGVYSPLMTEMGRAAAAHPDQLVFGLLKGGFADLCYDGQPFFGTQHKVLNDKGKEANQANAVGDGSGTVWYLLDTTRALKPLIYQTRKADNFVAMTAETDDNVFRAKQFVYGVDARRNAGYGFWQLAYASNEALTAETLKAALTAMRTRTGDGGRPLGIRPNLLVVPGALQFQAKKLLENELIENAAGTAVVSNDVRGAAQLLVADWL
ncbi:MULTISPECIES: Mu-like prophage major head subunit gpT family protein [Betaproteobacteria]|uniref:Mu-like prophage major head subunit gpT family protein n=1 Tax=Betaproteobacteria TaxID=28216 RepID=UPI003A89CFE6